MTAPHARRVTGLYVYPLKSAGGIPVSEIEVDQVGLREDRAWMVIDAAGRFVSQRTEPRMALLRPRLLDGVLEVGAPDAQPLRLPRATPESDGYRELGVWKSHRYAVDCGDEAARWVSDVLGAPCRVVRAVRPDGAPLLNPEGRVHAGFADAAPALVVSTASLDDLNRRLDRPLPMNRFRPNIVVEGFGAFEEDRWGELRVGEVPTRGWRPCSRCVTTLVDQDSGERGKEPLRTLATFRRNADGEVDFGVNVFFEGAGVLRVGDPVG